MTLEIAVVLLILLAAMVLFVTEWLRMDVVALLVLAATGITGLVTPAEAISGFSSPAVVTVWATFIISGGLTLTGVADILARRVVRVAGQGEVRLVVTIMTTAGVLSSFMNNVGVTALMLPVVMQIARRTRRPPSRLLLPMALASVLGGLTTLIGTPPNILVADAVRGYGLPTFRLFDFTPIGGSILVAGIAFVALVGRRFLPEHDPLRETAPRGRDPGALYDLGERLFTIQLPVDSPLVGRTIERSRLGAALRMNVVAVVRNGRTILAPPGATVLEGGDRLLALGRMDLVSEVRDGTYLNVERSDRDAPQAMLADLQLTEGRLSADSPLAGKPLYEARLRERFGVHVVAVRRGGEARYLDLQNIRLKGDDVLLLHCPEDRIDPLRAEGELVALRPVPSEELREHYQLPQRLLTLSVPEGSTVAGRTLKENRFPEVLGLNVWAIRRGDDTLIMPASDDALEPGDKLLVQGTAEDLEGFHALQGLEIESHSIQNLDALQSATVGIAELVLSPETTLAGRTLRDLDFRDRYGVTVLALYRQGRAHRTGLRNIQLLFGDAILVHGPREKLRLLTRDPDFVVVSEPPPPPPRREKAPLAVGILAAVLVPVLLGWLPIALAMVTGAALMVATRCLAMEEAYRFIEWQAVFLVAGMLPLGLAMERTGAAQFLAEGVVTMTGTMGPTAVLAGLFVLTSLATQVVPTAALVVLMLPIAFNTATGLGASPLPFMMGVAMAASASFSSPVASPSNVLIMGPGGYRFMDYVKVGVPLTLIAFALVLVIVPLLWPFTP